jgi:hypothetical protein
MYKGVHLDDSIHTIGLGLVTVGILSQNDSELLVILPCFCGFGAHTYTIVTTS